MKNSYPQWDSNPVTSAYEANALTIVLRDLMSIEHLQVDRILHECVIKIYLYHVGDVVKCFVVYNILLTLCSQQTSKLVKQQNDTNMLCKNKRQIILQNQPRATGKF